MSKGQFSIFLTWTDLGSEKHQTQAEVDDTFRVCRDAKIKYGVDISSIPVDNAARGVAAKVAALFTDKTVLVIRDPGHCLDLCSKDLAKTSVVKSVMEEAKEVRDFVKTDRIDSMRVEAYNDGDLDRLVSATTMCETRMNLTHDFVTAARAQQPFVLMLPSNPKWHTYFNERKKDSKKKLEEILDRYNDRKR